MTASTKPTQWEREKSERLGGEGDQIKFIDMISEQVSYHWFIIATERHFCSQRRPLTLLFIALPVCFS